MRPLGSLLATGLAVILLPRPGWAQISTLDEDERARRRPPPEASTDLLDPGAHTRVHLVTRISLEGDGDTFGGQGSLWVFEPQLMVRVAPGVTLGGNVPILFSDRQPVLDTVGLDTGEQVQLGNIRLSGVGATSLALQPMNDRYDGPRLHLGLGLDIYLPTHAGQSRACEALGACVTAFLGQGLRAYEPALFTPDAALGRVRGQVAFSVVGLHLSLEGGITSGWYVAGPFEADALVAFGWGTRLHYTGWRAVAPFLELVGSGQIEGPTGGGTPIQATADGPNPLQLSLGARGFIDQFMPALFVTFDFERETAFFGVDIGGFLRPSPSRGEGERLRMGL